MPVDTVRDKGSQAHFFLLEGCPPGNSIAAISNLRDIQPRLRRSATLQLRGTRAIRGAQRIQAKRPWRVALPGNRVATIRNIRDYQPRFRTSATLQLRGTRAIRGAQRIQAKRPWRVALPGNRVATISNIRDFQPRFRTSATLQLGGPRLFSVPSLRHQHSATPTQHRDSILSQETAQQIPAPHTDAQL